MNCQIFGLDKGRKNQCRKEAQVTVTYPRKNETIQLWRLCLVHYIQCLKYDAKHVEEFPPNWIQEIRFIRSDDDAAVGV